MPRRLFMPAPSSKRYFVTGATGFLGSFLVRRLICEGHDVSVMVREPQSASSRELMTLLPTLHIVQGDLDNLDPLGDVLREMRPDAILHLAWNGIDALARNSTGQLIQNVQSTLTLLDLCRSSGCPVFAGFGSQAEYGIADGVLHEDSPCRPITAYGVAKHALSELALKFGEITSTRVLWFRIFSAYGPHDHPNHLLPSLITSMLRGTCPPLTAGEQTWDYLYAEDAVKGILAALNAVDACGIFNLASGQQYSLRHVIESVRDLVDSSIHLKFGELPYRRDQVMMLAGSVDRLRDATGWRPEVSLEEGLKETVAWYRQTYSQAPNSQAYVTQSQSE